MTFAADVDIASIAKHREELCGDNVEILRTDNAVTIILSDGLGSGVKASILSTMTTKIAYGLLRRNVSLDVVFETIADTLPVCRVRGLAYSTLTICQIKLDGMVKLIEYENPPALLLRKRRPVQLQRSESVLGGKAVIESEFRMQNEDLLLLVSDGIIHAGVGGLFKLGLGFEGLMQYLPNPEETYDFTRVFSKQIVELAEVCYEGKPGDDSTAVVLRLRLPRKTVVLTGPSQQSDNDREIVSRFASEQATKRVVCGGTTGKVVSRELGKKIKTQLTYGDPSVPPIAEIEGIDLTTEGILTLNKCLKRLCLYQEGTKLPDTEDGATLLARTLLSSDAISFWVGEATNPAHENLDQLVQLASRRNVVDQMAEHFRSLGKQVDVQYV